MKFATIIKIVLIYHSHNIATIFMSSIACSTKVNFKLIRNLNGLLYNACTKYGFHFGDNGAVSKCDLWKYGIHLLETGKIIITNNFIGSINYFLENTIPPISSFWTIIGTENKDKLSSEATTRLSGSLNRSFEMSVNDVCSSTLHNRN